MINSAMIVEFSEAFNVIVDGTDTEYKPYIQKGPKIYDPRNEFRPVDGKGYALDKKAHELAYTMIRSAEEKWKENVSSVIHKQVEIREQKAYKQAPAGSLEEVIVSRVSENLLEGAKERIDEFIRENYGSLPRKVVVESNGEKREITGVTHEKFDDVLKLVNANIPVFLTGPAGSGKNVLCKQVSEALGLKFFFSNAVTQEYKLTGFIDAHGNYQETEFYRAFTEGGIFMLDEVDASTPEVLVILNCAIANRYFDFPNGKYTAHQDFRVIAAGNTFGTGADIEYVGRYQLDAATLDRFAIIEIDYSEAIETAIASGNIDALEFILGFRKAVKSAKMKFIVSYRALDRLVAIDGVFKDEEAIRIAVTKSLRKDDIAVIAGQLNFESGMPGWRYASALKKIAA